MKSRKLAITLSAATLALMASTVTALAVPAYAKSAVNVRTGPSTSYNRVDTLHAGENVEVTECNSGWCYIQHNGPDGWVSGNYLRSPRNNSNNGSVSGTINFGLNFGSGGPTFSVTIGNTNTQPSPIRGPRVCFFEDFNYGGQSFCVRAGEEEGRLRGFWNNRISSIKVYGGARVHVCENWNHTGACYGYASNVPRLPARINNDITGYRTWR